MALDIMAAFTNEPPELDFIWPGFLAGTVGALVAPGGGRLRIRKIKHVKPVAMLATA